MTTIVDKSPEIHGGTQSVQPAASTSVSGDRKLASSSPQHDDAAADRHQAGKPNLLAIDTTNGSAYFGLDISEGNARKQSVLWVRHEVVDGQVTELELYISRSQGDHGFSFLSEELAIDYKRWMSPPTNRQKATRSQLKSLSEATFNPNSTFSVKLASDCQFTEGWHVIDPGSESNGSTSQHKCNWPQQRPVNKKARVNLIIDEATGLHLDRRCCAGQGLCLRKRLRLLPNDMTVAQ